LSLFLYVFFGLIGLFLLLFAWSVRKPRRPIPSLSDVGACDECGRRHITYLPQVLQAFSKSDYEFLFKNAPPDVLYRVRRERRGVALAYLAALREDFQGLLRMARAIAVLSPELDAVHELERLRLTAKFAWQYKMIRWKLIAGATPALQLNGLSNLVSALSVRMEAAMKELGERAAVAAQLASSMNRRGLNVG
jgi:hypothetical protein